MKANVIKILVSSAEQKSNIVWPLPMDMMGSFYSSKSSFDIQPHTQNEFPNRREEVHKKPTFQNRQPRPEVSSPPKVMRKEQPMTRPQNATVSTTHSSGTFVPVTTNANVPVQNSQPIMQSTQMAQTYKQLNFNNEPNTFMPPTANQQQSFAPPANLNGAQSTRLPTPPVTSTVSSNMAFNRQNSAATLTEICTSEDEEDQTQPIQRASQTPVFNYVH